MNKRIVLIHGWGANTKRLTPLASHLKKLGWSVYIPKLPGFDLKPPKKPWDVNDYAKYVMKESTSHFKGDYFVFGHSFGGRVVAKMVVKNKGIKGIVFCSTSGVSRKSIVKRVPLQFIAKLGKFAANIPVVGKYVRKIFYVFIGERDYLNADEALKETFKNVISEDIKPYLDSINIPALILWGDKDTVTPVEDAYYLDNHLKNSKLEIFKTEGHTLPYTKHIDIADTINKWAKK